ncbi:MAG TPA: hypothetical protein VLB68_00330 [Pyrinomonadaceae bacterium]|nr:hypothetical protein [Pyrinomonadaceae bacterium]
MLTARNGEQKIPSLPIPSVVNQRAIPHGPSPVFIVATTLFVCIDDGNAIFRGR